MSAALALVLARPQALWALALPVLFLLLLRLTLRPREVVIGTLALWKELPLAAPRGARTRGRIPPWAWCVAAGLLLGTLAWLGPRGGRARVPRVWTCVLDRSPSMGLALGPTTRLARALELADGWLARAAGSTDRVRWQSGGRATLELARGELPPPAWLEPTDGEEPEWERFDAPGTLWITDAAPPCARRFAGLFASGGPRVEGLVASAGDQGLRWVDGELRAEPLAGLTSVRLREPAGQTLPPVLERVLAAWCAARGLELTRAASSGCVLTFALEPGPEDDAQAELELARDGWRARGRGAALSPLGGGSAALEGAAAESDDWLVATDSAGAPRLVLDARRGLLRTSLREFGEPAGDPARFALSFGRLLDRCVLPASGVVALAERRAAGGERREPGAAPPEGTREGADLGPRIDAGLALAAALCALLALRLRA